MCRYARLHTIAPLVWAVLLVLAVSQTPSRVHALSGRHRAFLPAIAKGSGPWSATELQVFDIVNLQRKAAGCPAAQLNRELSSAAKTHSQDMATHNFFGHIGSDGSAFFQRAQRAGYTYFAAGEIIGGGYDSPTAVVDGWMGSPGHRAIILTCANTDIGVGFVNAPSSSMRTYWTAVFGQR